MNGIGRTFYFASPGSQMHAAHLEGLPVLLSYACYSSWLDNYQQSFSRILIDSGAFSEMNGKAKVDIGEYKDWSVRWRGHADAIAGLDDIMGDWKRSMSNYESIPWSFPTFHPDSDPPELLDDLVSMSRERGRWIGIGLVPPRGGREDFVRATLDRIPSDIHIHGWACRCYSKIRRFDSMDSTNWWRDGMAYRVKLPFLTYSQALQIVIWRYTQEACMMSEPASKSSCEEISLFPGR